MNLPLHFSRRGIRQMKQALQIVQWCAKNNTHLSYLNKCTNLSVVPLSQTSAIKPQTYRSELERGEVILLKTLLASNEAVQAKELICRTNYAQNQVVRPALKTDWCEYRERLLLWEKILLNETSDMGEIKQGRLESNNSQTTNNYWNFESHNKQVDKSKAEHPKKICKLEFKAKNELVAEKQQSQFVGKKTNSGPSPEQLSLVLLRLREELPYFFEGYHRYSIYSEDILFVNRLTRTTTRSLKSYRFIMKFMQYAGKMLWMKASLDVLRITKHPEDNTIRVRWTAKGIPWYQTPFYVLTGNPHLSLFYRYVDGFSIFEVGRDGLVHCHRLDKVMPTSSPEQQKWSVRMQILTLLGLADISRGACEAFQAKKQDLLKKL